MALIMNLPVYLDNHATTPADPRVVEAMMPYLSEVFGNAATTAHPDGWKAKEAVEKARAQVAALAGAEPEEVIFTSGATESINMVLKGIARKKPWSDMHIITCATEHSAVLDTCAFLAGLGARLTLLPVKSDGQLDLELLDQELQTGADLLSLMHANNEIGVLHPIDDIGYLCKKHQVLLHIDAAQTFGKIPVPFAHGLIDFLSISGHKMYAPKGIGCLFVKRRNPPLRLTPLIHGGGHERGFRSGTLNVPGVVALGKAADISATSMADEADSISALRNKLLERLSKSIPDLLVNGSLDQRLPGNLNISIPGIQGQLLLPALRDKISVSSGSACTSAQPKPSHVLAAIGRSDDLAQSSLRFGIGRFNTEAEVLYAADTVVSIVHELRAAVP
jgi:cysteine desulfurase